MAAKDISAFQESVGFSELSRHLSIILNCSWRGFFGEDFIRRECRDPFTGIIFVSGFWGSRGH